jgi:Putative transposase, YhgA-like
MIADLLRGFVTAEWVHTVDLTTLERVHSSHVSDDLRDREDDIIWRVRWQEGWLYIYLLIEFQSTVYRYMAVRLMTYVGLLYEGLIRSRQLTSTGHLPPVVPIVLYNGRDRWTAVQDMAALVAEAPGGLALYRPRLLYLLIDVGRYPESELAPLRNLAAALFRLENSRTPGDLVTEPCTGEFAARLYHLAAAGITAGAVTSCGDARGAGFNGGTKYASRTGRGMDATMEGRGPPGGAPAGTAGGASGGTRLVAPAGQEAFWGGMCPGSGTVAGRAE